MVMRRLFRLVRVELAFVARLERRFAYQTFVGFVRFVGFAYQTIGLGGQSLQGRLCAVATRHLYRPVAAAAVDMVAGTVVDMVAAA